MKFTHHLLVGSCTILMTMSACEHSHEVSSPISAEINGILFSSDGFRRYEGQQSHYYSHEFYQEFVINRELISADGKNCVISVKKSFHAPDKVQLDTIYTCTCSINTRQTNDGLLKITKMSNGQREVQGEFEYVITDKETRDTIYIVKNGKFIIPYQ